MFKQLLRNSLRLFFRLLYGPFAWTYDWVAATVSIGMWQGWVLAVLPYLTSDRILELGHGPGHLQQALNQKGKVVFGLDASPQMGRLTRRRLLSSQYRLRLTCGQSQHLPFESASFAQIVATFPTEYIVSPETLNEIGRVLTGDGELIILPSAWITGQGWFHKRAADLFRVTGQAPTWNDAMLQPLRNAGFNLDIEEIVLENSQLLLIQASKNR